eukprot:13868084-Alexandrium_andersonii.AAC.1
MGGRPPAAEVPEPTHRAMQQTGPRGKGMPHSWTPPPAPKRWAPVQGLPGATLAAQRQAMQAIPASPPPSPRVPLAKPSGPVTGAPS